MVTGTGTLNEPRPAEIFMIQALTDEPPGCTCHAGSVASL
jgi:hypothetical protein